MLDCSGIESLGRVPLIAIDACEGAVWQHAPQSATGQGPRARAAMGGEQPPVADGSDGRGPPPRVLKTVRGPIAGGKNDGVFPMRTRCCHHLLPSFAVSIFDLVGGPEIDHASRIEQNAQCFCLWGNSKMMGLRTFGRNRYCHALNSLENFNIDEIPAKKGSRFVFYFFTLSRRVTSQSGLQWK